MVSVSGDVGAAQGKGRPTPQWALLPAVPQCSLPFAPGPQACSCLSVFSLSLNPPPPSFLLSLPHPCFCPLKRPQPPPDSLLCSWPPSRPLFSFPLSGDQEGQSRGYGERGSGDLPSWIFCEIRVFLVGLLGLFREHLLFPPLLLSDLGL